MSKQKIITWDLATWNKKTKWAIATDSSNQAESMQEMEKIFNMK